MKKYQFKTTLNCSSCVARVTPYLDANNEIKRWHVDTQGPDKILTIETDYGLPDDTVEQIVKKAGFKAEKLWQ